MTYCKHPNIMGLIDSWSSPTCSVLCMPFWPSTLQTVLGNLGKLNAGQPLVLASEIGAGLARMHELGILHNDIHTGNVFVKGRDACMYGCMDIYINKTKQRCLLTTCDNESKLKIASWKLTNNPRYTQNHMTLLVFLQKNRCIKLKTHFHKYQHTF